MKQIDKVHILASPISNTIYVGTLKEQKKGFCISENKIDRTHEFLKALTDIYGNSSWRIKGDKNFHCCVMDEETLEKNKDKTIGEFFKIKEAKKEMEEIANLPTCKCGGRLIKNKIDKIVEEKSKAFNGL